MKLAALFVLCAAASASASGAATRTVCLVASDASDAAAAGSKAWLERSPGERWPAGNGECAQLSCHPGGTVTVHRCYVDELPPGCVLASDRTSGLGQQAFPDCCPQLLCPPTPQPQPQPNRPPPAADFWPWHGRERERGRGLRTEVEAGPGPGRGPEAEARPARPKQDQDQQEPDLEPLVVAGTPITGKALRFYHRFMDSGRGERERERESESKQAEEPAEEEEPRRAEPGAAAPGKGNRVLSTLSNLNDQLLLSALQYLWGGPQPGPRSPDADEDEPVVVVAVNDGQDVLPRPPFSLGLGRAEADEGNGLAPSAPGHGPARH